MSEYRIWGELDWLQRQLGIAKWGLISCLGTEQRSLSVHHILAHNGILSGVRYADIENPRFDRSLEFEANKRRVRTEFLGIGGKDADIRSFELLGSTHYEIVTFVMESVAVLGSNIVLDVTAFPKRFFFPILRIALGMLKTQEIRNLLVTYGTPERYAEERLAWDHDDWSHLPLFQGKYTRRQSEKIIAAIGFETLGLVSAIEEGKGGPGPAVLLLPFPSSLRWVTRCWDTVEKIVKVRGRESEVFCCDTHDVSQAYNHLEQLCNYGSREVVFAPYGPKPLSVAIALLACKYDYPVYYTQPSHYHPLYSSGRRVMNGIPHAYGYVVGLDGVSLYGLRGR